MFIDLFCYNAGITIWPFDFLAFILRFQIIILSFQEILGIPNLSLFVAKLMHLKVTSYLCRVGMLGWAIQLAIWWFYYHSIYGDRHTVPTQKYKKEISTIISKTKKEIIMYSNNVFLCVKILANRLFDLVIVMIAFNDLHKRKNFFIIARV